MSIFTRIDVQRLARLARLEIADQELDLFARQLGEILEFARQVESVDTAASSTPEPDVRPADALREDVIQPSLDRQDVLAGAPEADAARGLFKVPRVFTE